ncbi:hypothetical protein QT381_07720 [Galbitalea sp. SE-J8]|uniref:hypothetical protein n=1 Tax=Galbitalea sp. SE-J8 TaxID=3054952 RepID=UPI00259CCFA3|nr:hypothetical protein [Galbitalea sp. SE-J8]MDM4762892.1 hypothetical protein [Galbitalea sp. SE-J8]
MPTFVAMRTRSWTVLVVIALLSGCASVTADPEPIPSRPTRISSSISLEQATAAFSAYLVASDAMARAGGEAVETMRPYVSEALFEREKAGAEALRSVGVKKVGSASFDHASLQADGPTSAAIHVCVDNTDSDLVDENGVSAVASGTPERQDTLVHLVVEGGVLVVDGLDQWTGAAIC